MTATILATGGAGYIGSHVVAELMASGRRVVILDDFSNAARDVPQRIAALGFGVPDLVEGDVSDPALLEELFRRFEIDAVPLARRSSDSGTGAGTAVGANRCGG